MRSTVRRVWQSAVARALLDQKKKQPLPVSRVERMIAQGEKGALPPQCAAGLAKSLISTSNAARILVPVNLIEICQKLGVTVEYRPLAVDGLLQESESGYVAIIDSTAKQTRQRMTLAHELGHLMLYNTTGLVQAFGHVSSSERNTIASSEIEELCDHFASELTMPSDRWRSFIASEGLSVTTLKKLQSLFGVSLTRAAHRLVEISEIECAIIVWLSISENENILRLEPLHSFSKRPSDVQALGRDDESARPGSPFYAIEKKMDTVGTISVALNGSKRKYRVQSNPIGTQHVISLLIPDEVRADVMRLN